MRRELLIFLVSLFFILLIIGVVGVCLFYKTDTNHIIYTIDDNIEIDSTDVLDIQSCDTLDKIEEQQQIPPQPLIPQINELTDRQTDKVIVYYDDENTADSRFVGGWQNIDNPQWYIVFYDDYDTDDYYWGKEWNEADNVYETDLNFHGNGWFRWRVVDNELQQLHSQDQDQTPIPKSYKFKIKDGTLELKDANFDVPKHSFRRTTTN